MLLVPLDTIYCKHKSRVAVWKAAKHTGTTLDPLVRHLNDLIDINISPVYWRKIVEGQSSLNVALYPLDIIF